MAREVPVEIFQKAAPGEDGHLAPERLEYIGKLRRHHASADDGDFFRELPEFPERVRRVYSGKGDPRDIRDFRPGTGGDDAASASTSSSPI